MNSRSKNTIFISLLGMSLSGILIFILDTFFFIQTEYGLRENPLIGEVKLIHNLFNFLFIFAVGRIYDGHIRLGLTGIKQNKKVTGVCLYVLIWIMTISGCLMLYMGDEGILEYLESIHLIVGFMFITLFIIHNFFYKKF